MTLRRLRNSVLMRFPLKLHLNAQEVPENQVYSINSRQIIPSKYKIASRKKQSNSQASELAVLIFAQTRAQISHILKPSTSPTRFSDEYASATGPPSCAATTESCFSLRETPTASQPVPPVLLLAANSQVV